MHITVPWHALPDPSVFVSPCDRLHAPIPNPHLGSRTLKHLHGCMGSHPCSSAPCLIAIENLHAMVPRYACC